MSKQSDAKKAQGYSTEPRNCKTCANRTCDTVLPDWVAREIEAGHRLLHDKDYYAIESKQRCSIGGFAVKMTATCSLWAAKT
jgi:hypothetical protein